MQVASDDARVSWSKRQRSRTWKMHLDDFLSIKSRQERNTRIRRLFDIDMEGAQGLSNVRISNRSNTA